jgi:hypothetical protein
LGQREILGFAARHARRFTPAETALILSGAKGPRAWRSFHDSLAGYGSLPGWNDEQVGEAIDSLLVEGALRTPRHGPWKQRLEPGT